MALFTAVPVPVVMPLPPEAAAALTVKAVAPPNCSVPALPIEAVMP